MVQVRRLGFLDSSLKYPTFISQRDKLVLKQKQVSSVIVQNVCLQTTLPFLEGYIFGGGGNKHDSTAITQTSF